jgi:hypothetical protein
MLVVSLAFMCLLLSLLVSLANCKQYATGAAIFPVRYSVHVAPMFLECRELPWIKELSLET